jgi:hypothetical protein
LPSDWGSPFHGPRVRRYAVRIALWCVGVQLISGWVTPHWEAIPRWVFYLGITGILFGMGTTLDAIVLRSTGLIRFPPFARRYRRHYLQALVVLPIAAALVTWAALENQQQALAAAQPKSLPVLYVPNALAPDGFAQLALTARWSDGSIHYTMHSSCERHHCFPNEVVLLSFQDEEGRSLAQTGILIPKATHAGSIRMSRRDFNSLTSWTPSLRNAWVRSEAICADGVTVSSTRDEACAKHGGVSSWRTLADEYGRTFIP